MAEQSGSWDDCLVYAAVSDVGMRRPSNQDARAIVLAAEDESWRFRGHVFMAADGMGAHAAGELASELAVAGGTPGAFLGQLVFRHKTRKKSFRFVFGGIVLMQLGLIGTVIYLKWIR